MRKFTVSMILVVLLVVMSSCITTKAPTGEVVTKPDLDTTIAITQLAFTGAQQAFDMWLQWEKQNATLDAATLAAETAARQQRLEILGQQLQALMELRAKQK